MELAYDNLDNLFRGHRSLQNAMDYASCGGESDIRISVRKPVDREGNMAFDKYIGNITADGLIVTSEDGTDSFRAVSFEIAYITVGN